MTLVFWLHKRTPYVILDNEKRITRVLAGRPLGGDGATAEWNKAVVDGAAAIDTARGKLQFSG
jgi:hypothetical protein